MTDPFPEVTPEMAAEGSRVLADMFEHAVAGDWLTMEQATEVFRRMVFASGAVCPDDVRHRYG